MLRNQKVELKDYRREKIECKASQDVKMIRFSTSFTSHIKAVMLSAVDIDILITAALKVNYQEEEAVTVTLVA